MEEAREKAEKIIHDAKIEADRIIRESESRIHKRFTFEDCIYSDDTFESWRFREASKKDALTLKESLGEIRSKLRIYANSPHSAIDWGVLSYSETSVILGMAGIQLIESSFDKIAKKALSAGMAHGKKALLEIIESVEERVSRYGVKVKYTVGYKALKEEELELLYLIEQLKQKEKERIRHEKELAREEAKAQKEFERELRKAKADEDSVRKALEKIQLEAAKEAANEKRFAKLQEQIEKLQAALKEAEERGQRIMSMAQQTRRGWVYVISNIGSFGEGVYKIGLTRRLDPMERVYELGDASVPFPFDVHAFIFSEDAPALETALHQAFDHCKLNSVNYRKEYFKVPLEKIKAKVKELGYDVEFEDYPYAPQFRDSVLRK